MNATRPPISAEITARTRLSGASIYHEQPDTAAVGCPQGDHDEMVISVAVDGGGVSGPIPKSAFTLSAPSSEVVFYSPVEADSDATLIEGKYRTTITVSQFGGCMSDSVTVKLNGAGIGKVALNVRNFDLATGASSYGTVNVADLGVFVLSYPPNPYGACADYRPPGDTAVDVGDLGIFTQHYFHQVGGGSGLVAEQPVASDGIIRLDVSEDDLVDGRRILHASVILENVEPFAVMALAFKNENPALAYRGWYPNPAYPKTTVAVETVRDGVRQVFVVAAGSGATSAEAVELGKLEFTVKSSQPLEFGPEDLRLLLADLLDPAGEMRTFSQEQFERTDPVQYRFELAQNYPNPFNPSTMIVFSLARPVEVHLAVYDVSGRLVRVLVNESRSAGNHRVEWDGRDGRGSSVASGVYFYRLQAGEFSATRKMVMLR